MRLAGNPEAARAANADFADQFMDLHGLLRSKGYSEQAAVLTATDMLLGNQPQAQMTRRFAGTYGDPS